MRTWLFLVLAGGWACTATQDFDAAFEPPTRLERCQAVCEHEALCIRNLESDRALACANARQPAAREEFIGFCIVVCLDSAAEPARLTCDNSRDKYDRDWRQKAPFAFENLCDGSADFCGEVCELQGTQSDLARWAENPEYNVPELCVPACERAELPRWRCVGQQQAEAVLAGEASIPDDSEDPEGDLLEVFSEVRDRFVEFAETPERCQPPEP